ncbi:GNAT family N-acetyltransferase [Glaciibacter flavus]|uniref:GNAT family N-acetyltransferase n=1 Tax=Orlajensenia flava TaxID=2565934 RepID=A0A4S4FXE1_9MICO|nr:GNAT family N-acetyltransferase [Glaciibacter flavus]THG35493.1 GNAT family N-acetyltransferase [Glaciibacter flavus]
MVTFRELRVDDDVAHALLAEYFAEREATFPSAGGYRTTFPAADQFEPPRGVFLVVDDEDRGVVGCGGIRRLGDGPNGTTLFEVKHLYLRPSARGLGAGRILLAELERRAAAFGAMDVVLDTNASLAAAGGLYRSSGYRDIEPYNDNPNATNWYGKPLAP